jgi:hypothetical protein
MADYHPLIARAVEALDKNTGENRRALYERARTALVAQLRGVVPALEESEITRERLALEEAIRKIEAESARRVREEARKPRSELPPRREQGVTREPSAAPRAPAADPVRNTAPAAERSISTRRSLAEEAVRGFRDTVERPLPSASRRTATQTVAEQTPAAAPPPAQEYDELEIPPRDDDSWSAPLEPPPGSQLQARQRASARPKPPPALPTFEDLPPPRQSRGSNRSLVVVVLLLVLIGALGAVAWWKRAAIGEYANRMMASMRGPTQPVKPAEVPNAPPPKSNERITQQQTQPGAQVAQRVVLYEEDPNDPQGKKVTGTAVWSTELIPPSPGRQPEIAVRAKIEIPERQMSVTWSLRRNTDASLPASHTIEIMFTLPPDAPSGGVQNVPGVLMKQSEQTRGVPLAGLAVKVTPGYFLIGLSSLETDVQRNLQLLKERPWFDIPIVYNNNRRAILAMEKGVPGEKAFNDAFAAWKQ